MIHSPRRCGKNTFMSLSHKIILLLDMTKQPWKAEDISLLFDHPHSSIVTSLDLMLAVGIVDLVDDHYQATDDLHETAYMIREELGE